MRPIQKLNAFIKKYPDTSRHIASFYAGRGKELPAWPSWCFLPMSAWYSIVSHTIANGHRLGIDQIKDVAVLSALGTWRFSQGIYHLDPDLFQELIESKIPEILPSEVFYRLPEWCLYVATPGLSWFQETLHGFWVHLEWDYDEKRTELRFLMDCESDLKITLLHLGNWSVLDAVEKFLEESQRQSIMAGTPLTIQNQMLFELANQIKPLLSLLLYLCSDAPDIDDLRIPGSYPSYAKPEKIKKGWRFFPPDKPRIWSVGVQIGDLLRKASGSSGSISLSGHSKRMHMRRGHWHGYWLGPRKKEGERRFVYRWLSPLLVGNPEA